MANRLSTHSFKVELEFTVEIDEVAEELLGDSLPKSALLPLKAIQQSLLENKAALQQVMLQRVFTKLQEYADYLAAQELTNCLETNSLVDQENLDIDQTELTRPLRTTCLRVQLAEGVIRVKSDSPGSEPDWLPIWRDLRPETEFGHLLDSSGVPQTPILWSQIQQGHHYLMVRYMTRQPDGVHIAGRCSCDQALEGLGNDDCQAFDTLWADYKRHITVAGLAHRMDRSTKQLFLED